MNADISVIIPTYQHAQTIRLCVESVRAQTLKPAEIIVVNDGSTDGTDEVLTSISSCVTILTQPNLGGNVARNNGFAASHGARVIFCDADVILRPDALQCFSDALDRHPDASYAYARFRFGWKQFAGYRFDSDRLRRMNYIHTTSLIRREHVVGFDPAIRRFQDWDMWLTMLSAGHRGVFVPEELFRILHVRDRKGISEWRPSVLYQVPWNRFGWTPKSIRQFEEAKRIVLAKHGL